MHVGQEYRPPFYGHISLFNLNEHLISPFVTGYEGTGIESLYPSNTDIFRYAKQQGGIGAYVHPYYGDADPLETHARHGQGLPGRRRARVAQLSRAVVAERRRRAAAWCGTTRSTTASACRSPAAKTRSRACTASSWSASSRGYFHLGDSAAHLGRTG